MTAQKLFCKACTNSWRLELNEKKQAYENCTVENELEIAGYYQLEKQVESLNASIKRRILQPKHLVPFFHAGRLLKVIF